MAEDIESKPGMPARGTAFICLLSGVLILAVSLDWIAVPPTSMHAPRRVVGAVGLALILLGLLVGRWWPNERINRSSAAALLTLFGIVGGWVALCGSADGFRMGFAEGEVTTAMSAPWPARLMFGFGAAVALAWAAILWRGIVRRRL